MAAVKQESRSAERLSAKKVGPLFWTAKASMVDVADSPEVTQTLLDLKTTPWYEAISRFELRLWELEQVVRVSEERLTNVQNLVYDRLPDFERRLTRL